MTIRAWLAVGVMLLMPSAVRAEPSITFHNAFGEYIDIWINSQATGQWRRLRPGLGVGHEIRYKPTIKGDSMLVARDRTKQDTYLDTFDLHNLATAFEEAGVQRLEITAEYTPETRVREKTVMKSVPETKVKTITVTKYRTETRTREVTYWNNKTKRYEKRTREYNVRVPYTEEMEQTYTVMTQVPETVTEEYTVHRKRAVLNVLVQGRRYRLDEVLIRH